MELLTSQLLQEAFGEHAPLAASLARPSARIVPVDDPGAASVQLGGLPLLPDGVDWPTWGGFPLDFVADVDLAAVHEVLPDAPLPGSGRWLFFLATSLFGPDGELVGALEPRSRPGWRVVHVPAGSDRRPAAPPDEGDNPLSLGPYSTVHGRLEHELTIPDTWESGIPEAWGGDEIWPCFEHLDLQGWRGPFHRIGGWPQPTQSAPAVPAALAAAGLTAADGTVDWTDARVREVGERANTEWWLVLQLDTDDGPDGPGWMWGDSGVVFHYGRPEQLRAGAVDEVWVNWDCS